MFNLLKSDCYRLVHGKMLWVMTGVVLAMAAFMVAALSFVSSPEFLYASSQSMEFAVSSSDEVTAAFEEAAGELESELDNPESMSDAGEPERAAAQALRAAGKSSAEMTVADFEDASRDMRTLASPTDMLGDAGFSGGEVPLLVSILVALFFASDLSTGFVRNLVMDRRGRVRYYGEKLLLIAVASLYFVLLVAVSCAVAFAVGGFTYAAGNTPGEIAAFLALAWLIACAYSCMTAVLVWLTRSAGAGIAFAIVVGTGMAGALLGQIFLYMGQAAPWLASIVPWMLASGQNALAGGIEGILPASSATIPAAARIAVASVFWMALSAGLSLGFLRKRDV